VLPFLDLVGYLIRYNLCLITNENNSNDESDLNEREESDLNSEEIDQNIKSPKVN
jgi:hypothetical protein